MAPVRIFRSDGSFSQNQVSGCPIVFIAVEVPELTLLVLATTS